jgi:hypothetical protein
LKYVDEVHIKIFVSYRCHQLEFDHLIQPYEIMIE